MIFDSVSQANLKGLSPALVGLAQEAADALYPLCFRVYSGLRTAAQQDALYAQGRTTEGKIVTQAKAGQSSHNYGLAFDAVPFKSGQSGDLNWDAGSQQFRDFVAGMKAVGLLWGGDWRTFKDMDHFYIGPANPTPEMIAAYEGGDGIEAVWSQFA